jgi:hypothetical protein
MENAPAFAGIANHAGISGAALAEKSVVKQSRFFGKTMTRQHSWQSLTFISVFLTASRQTAISRPGRGILCRRNRIFPGIPC